MNQRLPLQPSFAFARRLPSPMLPEITPAPLEQARLEQAFFIEIIRLAPEGTDLVITNDSWEGLPLLFGQRMTIAAASHGGEWVVALTPDTKEFVVQQALSEEVHTKFVHFYLVQNCKELFTSYDRMSCLILDPGFPKYHQLQAHFLGLSARLG